MSDPLNAALLERAMREKARRAQATGQSRGGRAMGERSRRAQQAQQGRGVIPDIAAEGAKGIGRGVAGLLALPSIAQSALDKGFTAITGIPTPAFEDSLGGIMMGAAETAMPRAAQTTPGEYAGTIGEFVPGAAIGGGAGLAARAGNLAKYAVVPGAASEAAGQLTEGTAVEPYARLGAAIAAPGAVTRGNRALRRAVTPLEAGDRLGAAQVLEREGVKTTAGQAMGSEAVQYREAATKAGREMVDGQLKQFTRAALRRIGADSDLATPEVLVQADARIGDVFESVAKGVDIAPSSQTLTRSSEVIREYGESSAKSGQVPLIAEIHRKLTRAFRSGDAIPSARVIRWRSVASKLTRSPDPVLKSAAVGMIDVLDDVVEGTLSGLGRSGDVERIAKARKEWASLMAIEDAATRAGEAAASGIITPANLRSSLVSQNRRLYARGGGELNEMARAGVQLIKPLPQSGTQPRTLARELTSGAQGGTAAGLGAAAMGLDPALAATIGAGAVMAPRVINRAVSSPAGQAYLRNQLLPPVTERTNQAARTLGLLSASPLGD